MTPEDLFRKWARDEGISGMHHFDQPRGPTVKFKKLHPQAILPRYQTSGAAGMDLHADIPKTYRLFPGERQLFATGVAVEIPPGYEGQVRTRSGLALRNGIVVLNAPGTIDSDFREQVGVILLNTSARHAYEIQPGDRIAQLVIAPAPQATIVEVEELSETERGAGGFGSTGK